MNILIATTTEPFVRGGDRNFVEWLAIELARRGHDVERLDLPFSGIPALLGSQLNAIRSIEISSRCDLLITARPPAYALRHPNKVAWFIHHLRGFYDFWGTEFQALPTSEESLALREALFAFDNATLRECKAVYSNSATVAKRLCQYNGIEATVLYPPLLDMAKPSSTAAEDYVVCVARVEPPKRQDLFVQALAHCTTPVRLVLRGRSQGAFYPDHLRALISSLGLQDRVDFEERWATEEEKAELIGRSLAVCYAPVDEDSYGYVTLEAATCAKAIITTSDSGGVLEFVRGDLNGVVADPTPQSIATALDGLYLDRSRAKGLGEAARATIEELDISWDHVCQQLTGERARPT